MRYSLSVMVMPGLGRHLRLAALALFCLTAGGETPASASATEEPVLTGSVQGKLLVARPKMGDPRFEQTVILMIRHDNGGAFGLVVNKLLGVVEITSTQEKNGRESQFDLDLPAFYGGPVNPESGFIVHSPEYELERTVPVTNEVAVTTDPQILADIAADKGPKRYLYVVGNSGWGPGQLEGEMERGTWYVAPIDPDALFSAEDAEEKWRQAVENRLRGI